jgi:hypothetical protein
MKLSCLRTSGLARPASDYTPVSWTAAGGPGGAGAHPPPLAVTTGLGAGEEGLGVGLELPELLPELPPAATTGLLGDTVLPAPTLVPAVPLELVTGVALV